jgi:hypothetical protein
MPLSAAAFRRRREQGSEALYFLLALLMMASVQTALAAKKLAPPIEDLQSAPERVRVVIAEASEKSEPEKIRFAVTDRLSGEAPDEVVLRTDADSFADVTVGRSYLVAWSDMRRARRLHKGWEEDPDGPSIVIVNGLGSTALFAETPELRYLFSPGAITAPDDAARQIDALLDQMRYEDQRGRGLVINELFLREDLTARMTAAQAEKLKSVLQDVALDPQHHDLLLRAAFRVSPELTMPWLGEELRRIIIWHGSQYDPHSLVPALVRTAARGLKTAGNPSDVELLSVLLYANNPGVSKAALETMDHLDSAAAAAKAEQALARGWIHSETQNALTRFLNPSGP